HSFFPDRDEVSNRLGIARREPGLRDRKVSRLRVHRHEARMTPAKRRSVEPPATTGFHRMGETLGNKAGVIVCASLGRGGRDKFHKVTSHERPSPARARSGTTCSSISVI